MSDNNYSRMPDVGSDEVEVEEKDEMIFKDPKQIETSHEPKVSESADDKKERLKEHLARCRVKSAEVRKAKKAEKQANKKPRGRPKKLKEPLLPVVEEENQVVMEVKETIPPTPNSVGIAKPDEPINKDFNMIDYQKLTDMIAAKMKPVAPVAKAAPPPQQKIVNNQEQMGNFLTQYTQAIRLQEQKKAKEQMAAARKEALHKNTKKYYGKLPPVNYFQSENNWDNIFNPK
tara:strand:+ start:1213 stop:1905 length:693 start_codon:yes stop_codon:yes gene_type:complete